MSHIFISYSHKDKTYAHKLQQHLLEQGFNVWMDDRIEYGANWPREIERRLKECAVFILIMSPNSSESRSVQNELVFVQELNKPIFPLLLDGEGWWNIKSIQYLDVRSGKLPPNTFIDCLAKYAPRFEAISHPEGKVNLDEELSSSEDNMTIKKEKQEINLKKLEDELQSKHPQKKKTDVIEIIGLILTITLLIFGDNVYQQIRGHPVFQTPTPNPTVTSNFGLTPVNVILPTTTPFPTETPASLAIVASVTVTSVPEIASPTATETAISPPDYSCVTVNEQPAENTQIRRGKTFKVMFTVVNNGATVWPENLILDISSNPYGTVDAAPLPKKVPQVQPGDSINVGPFDAKAPTKDGHYVVSFKIGDGFCLPYVAFDVIR